MSHNPGFTTLETPGPEKPKLFTKKFIIFAVVGVVLIAGAVVAGVVVQNNKKGGNSNTGNVATANNSDEALNLYINYITSGNASATGTSFNYNPNEQYFIKTILRNYVTKYFALQNPDDIKPSKSEAKQDILNTKSYFDEYYNQAFKERTSDDATVYKSVLDIFAIIVENQPDESELLSAYLGLDEDFSRVSAVLSDKLQPLDSDIASIYNALYVKYLNSLRDFYREYSERGCVTDDALDSSCENVSVEIIEQAYTSRRELDNFFNEYTEYLFYNCQNLKTWAAGGDNNE